MAYSTKAHRAVAVGISGGLGVALPFAAYAASVPFDAVHEVIGAEIAPFAIGAVAGVGIMAISAGLMDRRAARRAEEEAEAASFGAAFADAETIKAQTAREERTKRGPEVKGVPVISRAVDAMSEDDAWAEIDSMLTDDSPISCDPTRSKDMYQIALDELRQRTGVVSQAVSSQQTAATPRPAAQQGAPAPTSLAQQILAARAAAAATAAAEAATGVIDADAIDIEASRAAAMMALYGAGASHPMSRAVVPNVPVISSVTPAPAAVVAAVAANVPSPAVSAPQTVEVPMADYSGHEDMWASALAILAEDTPVPVSAEKAAPAAQVVAASVPHVVPAPSAVSAVRVAAPAAPSLEDTGAFLAAAARAAEHRKANDKTGSVAPDRMAAVAEGAARTGMHAHVNKMLEEEFDRVPSSSVHRTTHEYLRVIQGGTSAMPRLQVEA